MPYIDRDKLIKRWSDEHGGAYFLPSEIVSSIEEQPTVDIPERNVGKWIPVTERLPEKDGMYLVSISPQSRMEKRVDTDFYSHFGVWQIFGKFVTAWCELPDPYKESEVEDDETIH